MRTFEQYLRDNEHIIDYAFRVTVEGNDVKIVVHPANQSGETIDFEVIGNALITTADIKE